MRRNATKTVQFDVEQVSSLLWNHFPVSRGMGVHFAVEYASINALLRKAKAEGQDLKPISDDMITKLTFKAINNQWLKNATKNVAPKVAPQNVRLVKTF